MRGRRRDRGRSSRERRERERKRRWRDDRKSSMRRCCRCSSRGRRGLSWMEVKSRRWRKLCELMQRLEEDVSCCTVNANRSKVLPTYLLAWLFSCLRCCR